MEFDTKFSELLSLLQDSGKAMIAFSGGVDSTFLLKVAHDVLGDNVQAVMGLSPKVQREQLAEARKLAEGLGVSLITVETEELELEEFVSNPPERCFICKKEIFKKIRHVAQKQGFNHVFDGTNADDLSDFRPGMEAARQFQIRSPLLEAGITKDEIRFKSHELGLPTWDRQASTCLATRFPYGRRITLQGLAQVEKAESYLHGIGFKQVRARHYGESVRIEVEKGMIPLLARVAEPVVDFVKSTGFKYVCLDLEGYRQGSLNEMFPGKITVSANSR